MNMIRALLVPALALLISMAIPACGASSVTIAAYKRVVTADDGYPLSTYSLRVQGAPEEETPTARLFYLVGSEPMPIAQFAAEFDDLVMSGLSVVLTQPRGVQDDGTVDRETFDRFDTRSRRVADAQLVLHAYLDGKPSSPVLLFGSSQGGVDAAAIAPGDPRVTHLVLLGSGGGWTQAEELTHFAATLGSYLGLSKEELDRQLEAIRAAPDASELWAGHPFRHWSSYLWYRPLDDLTSLAASIFVAHGTADHSVPVASARALRDRFVALGKQNLRYFEVEGANHSFVDAQGRSVLPELQRQFFSWARETGIPLARSGSHDPTHLPCR